MPTQVQFRRGTTAQNNSFTGAVGEVSVDIDKDTLRIHDGATQGGFELAKVDLTNVSGATNLSLSGISTASQLSTGASGTGINITTNTISGPATITIDPAAVGDDTGLVVIKGDLQIDGTQFIVNSTTIELADFIVGIASTATTDTLADGAGIKIGSDNTLTYDHSNTSLKSSENFNLASGKTYKIDGTDVLSATTLGSAVVNSSLTSVGTLTNLNVGNVYSSGIITATSFVGDGSGLTGAGSTVADDTTTNQSFFPVFTLTTSGTITASKVSSTKLIFNPSSGALSATDFNSTSDINLKENIKIIENPIEKVLQLNGVSFDWKNNHQSSIGVIAQEVEEVFPELVKESNSQKSVNYNGLIGVLIEVVKEQQKQIDKLKAIIENQ
jgi:hypothetical protein